jgi:hypothetical protein
MTADDLKRIAERYTELMHPGEWQHMTDAQKAVSLLPRRRTPRCEQGFLVRKSPVRVLVDQDGDQHQALA